MRESIAPHGPAGTLRETYWGFCREEMIAVGATGVDERDTLARREWACGQPVQKLESECGGGGGLTGGCIAREGGP